MVLVTHTCEPCIRYYVGLCTKNIIHGDVGKHAKEQTFGSETVYNLCSVIAVQAR